MSATTRHVEQYFQDAGLGSADLRAVLDAVAHHFDVPVTVMAPKPTPGPPRVADPVTARPSHPSSETAGAPAK